MLDPVLATEVLTVETLACFIDGLWTHQAELIEVIDLTTLVIELTLCCHYGLWFLGDTSRGLVPLLCRS